MGCTGAADFNGDSGISSRDRCRHTFPPEIACFRNELKVTWILRFHLDFLPNAENGGISILGGYFWNGNEQWVGEAFGIIIITQFVPQASYFPANFGILEGVELLVAENFCNSRLTLSATTHRFLHAELKQCCHVRRRRKRAALEDLLECVEHEFGWEVVSRIRHMAE